jgi:ferredoxin
MRITVDLNRCQAYAQCCSLAPEVFQLRGQEVIYYNPEPDESQRLHILRSKAACPVQAIFVEDKPSDSDSTGSTR